MTTLYCIPHFSLGGIEESARIILLDGPFFFEKKKNIYRVMIVVTQSHIYLLDGTFPRQNNEEDSSLSIGIPHLSIMSGLDANQLSQLSAMISSNSSRFPSFQSSGIDANQMASLVARIGQNGAQFAADQSLLAAAAAGAASGGLNDFQLLLSFCSLPTQLC